MFKKIFKLKADEKLFDYILEKTLPSEKDVCSSSSNLSLFLTLKNIALEHFKGHSNETLKLDILGNKYFLIKVNALIRA